MPKNQGISRAFWEDRAVRAVRRGFFWIAGERVNVNDLTYQRGPMFVEWEAPEVVTKPFPIILVHGGGFQGLEWIETPDGRPGWAQRLVDEGYAVLVVDRPAHGRSPFHTDTVGPMGPAFSYEGGKKIYFPEDTSQKHTQWPFPADDTEAMDLFIAGYGPLPKDLAESQKMDAARLAQLLDRIGPAVLLTHSASGASGWLAADARLGLVRAIVAIEPMGPPFATIPNIGELSWGLAAAPLHFEPHRSTPDQLKNAPPGSTKLPHLQGLPILVVTAEASPFSVASPPTVELLAASGANAELLHLPDHGVRGNGHGLVYEKNSDQALQPVLQWLDKTINDNKPQS